MVLKKKEGWVMLEIEGTPREMGIQHGRALRAHLRHVLDILPYLVKTQLPSTISYTQYMRDCKRIATPILNQNEWRFIKEEIEGIVEGANIPNITYDFLVAWNMWLSMQTYYEMNHTESRCCAFIATGSATANGQIVMAHNTHSDFASGFALNVVLTVRPKDAISFCMQTAAGLVCSSADWFLCENGIIGCETTISNLNYLPDFDKGVPYFLRIRKAMQTANTMREYYDIMTTKSAGDYACTWFLGDTRSNEIMMFDNGLRHHGMRQTADGVFFACNEAATPEMGLLETTRMDQENPDSMTGSRYMRMDYLLNTKYKGKLDIAAGKRILADHYDASVNKYRKSKFTICRHKEISGKYAGATDGKVTTSELAKKMHFIGRFGSSCGRIYTRKRGVPAPSMPKHAWTQL